MIYHRVTVSFVPGEKYSEPQSVLFGIFRSGGVYPRCPAGYDLCDAFVNVVRKVMGKSICGNGAGADNGKFHA